MGFWWFNIQHLTEIIQEVIIVVEILKAVAYICLCLTVFPSILGLISDIGASIEEKESCGAEVALLLILILFYVLGRNIIYGW